MDFFKRAEYYALGTAKSMFIYLFAPAACSGRAIAARPAPNGPDNGLIININQWIVSLRPGG
jgi:hypothetical protein